MSYTPEEIADALDYAVLKPTATLEDINAGRTCIGASCCLELQP